MPRFPGGHLLYQVRKQWERTQVPVRPRRHHGSYLWFLAQVCGFQLLFVEAEQPHQDAPASMHISTWAMWARLTAALGFGKTPRESPKTWEHRKLVRNCYKVISHQLLTHQGVSGSQCHSDTNEGWSFLLHHSQNISAELENRSAAQNSLFSNPGALHPCGFVTCSFQFCCHPTGQSDNFGYSYSLNLKRLCFVLFVCSFFLLTASVNFTSLSTLTVLKFTFICFPSIAFPTNHQKQRQQPYFESNLF